MSSFEQNQQIPVLRQPVPLLVNGPNSNNLAAAALAPHPVAALQQQQAPVSRNYGHGTGGGPNLEFVRHVYGSGLAMRLATEQKMFAGAGGIATSGQDLDGNVLYSGLGVAGLPSQTHVSSMTRDIVNGQDSMLDFKNYIGLPQHQPAPGGGNSEVFANNPHVVMEQQLGMHI
jgi:hypothetical protein